MTKKSNPKLRDASGVAQVELQPRKLYATTPVVFNLPQRITNSMGANGYRPPMPTCTRPGAGQLSVNGRCA